MNSMTIFLIIIAFLIYRTRSRITEVKNSLHEILLILKSNAPKEEEKVITDTQPIPSTLSLGSEVKGIKGLLEKDLKDLTIRLEEERLRAKHVADCISVMLISAHAKNDRDTVEVLERLKEEIKLLKTGL